MLFKMINLKMNNWKIPQTTPPINLGDGGENNATIINIEIDENEIIENKDIKYYFDIIDVVDGEKTIARTQELILSTITTIADEKETTVHNLQMKPTSQWLGEDGTKNLQVRCEYTDDTDSENLEEIVIKSNIFKGIVKMGLVK